MITLYTGPMNSGKTAKLIELYEASTNDKLLIQCNINEAYISYYDKFATVKANGKEIIPDLFDPSLDQFTDYFIKLGKVSPVDIFIHNVQWLHFDLIGLIFQIGDLFNDVYLFGLCKNCNLEPYYTTLDFMTRADEIIMLKAPDGKYTVLKEDQRYESQDTRAYCNQQPIERFDDRNLFWSKLKKHQIPIDVPLAHYPNLEEQVLGWLDYSTGE